MDRAPSLQHFPSEISERPEIEGPGYDYKEIAREVLARIDQRLADLEAVTPPDPAEARFRSEAASSSHQDAFVRRMARGLIGLLLAASLVATISFVWSHNETAMRTVARWVPGADPDSTKPAEKPESALPATAKVIVDAVPAQAAPPPRSAPDYDKPKPAPVPAELTDLMRKVDRNIAGLAQAVTDLRLAHQQATVGNAKTVEEIRASLDQMTRAIAMSATARAPEQTQAKPPAPAPQTLARRNRRYGPPYLSPNDAYGFMR